MDQLCSHVSDIAKGKDDGAFCDRVSRQRPHLFHEIGLSQTEDKANENGYDSQQEEVQGDQAKILATKFGICLLSKLIHCVEKYNADRVINDTFTKHHTEEFWLRFRVQHGDGGDDISGTQKRAHQQNLHIGQRQC